MKNQEAKFILAAYRPNGGDAGDAAFASALEHAEHDPELRAWFENQRKFDAVLSAKLEAIPPPAGLREAILAGARLSATPAKRRGWRNPLWLAAAAALVLTTILGVTLRQGAARPSGAELAAFALRDLAHSHEEHVGHPPELAEVQAQLVQASVPLTSHLKLDLDQLSKRNCRAISIGGRRVFEVCFQREGTWYHVYVGRRGDFAPGAFDPRALLKIQGDYASTTWADAEHVYALVTRAGAQAIQRLI